jgi:predicted lactoylglutathione lyase
MTTNIFVNLSVKDLAKSMDFFKALGFTFNKQFTDETAACMIVSETSYVMLLTEEKFREFTKKPIANAKETTEALIAFSVESRDKVKEMVEKALVQGGVRYNEPKDYGFMYQDAFADLDGHQWEVLYMDPNFVEKQ